jgi:cytochrome c-type biogenesis protein CcmH
MLALLLAVIIFAVVLGILVPLLRARPAGPDASLFDQAVYRDQLRELERDRARGVLTEAEAAAARLEVQRRLLAAAATPAGRATRGGASPVTAVVVALAIAGGSVGLYLRLGAPSVPDMPFASRKIEAPPAGGQALAALKQRTVAEPSNPEAWLLYARASADADQWADAATAFERAIRLGESDPGTLTAFGEMLTLASGGTVPPAARTAFAAALARDPSIEAARYYMALAAGEDGEPAKAMAQLQALLADLPANAPARAGIVQRIAEAAKAAGVPAPALPEGKAAAPGPDAAAMEAASQMPEADRQAMVRGMVAQLASKMETDPGNVDGWLRLGRAYAVLGDADKAADAYERAVTLKPDDAGILQQAAQAMLANQPATAPVPARAVAVLRRMEALTPGQPAVLWYLGLASAQNGDAAAARGFWSRLLGVLPAGGEEAKSIGAALEALKGK